MTLQEWIDRYETKTGDTFSVNDGFQLAFDLEHGFFVFGFVMWQGKGWLELRQTCVNSWQWVYQSVEDTVYMNNLAGVLTYTKRNPKAYAKLTGAKYVETLSDGCHVFVWEVQDVQS